MHKAFVRVAEGLRDSAKDIEHSDFDLVLKYVGSGGVEISRSLGKAVRFYREQRKLTRPELSKRCRPGLRAIIALERGQIKDMSIPRVEPLATGLGVDPGEFVAKVMEFEKASQ